MYDRKVFTVRISQSIIKPLKFLSVGLERTMGELVEEALRDLLKKYEPKASPKKGKS
jgi:hypothetical protein